MNVILSGVKRIVNTIRFTESMDPYQLHALSFAGTVNRSPPSHIVVSVSKPGAPPFVIFEGWEPRTIRGEAFARCALHH